MVPTYDETSVSGVCVSSTRNIFFNFSIVKWPLLDLSRLNVYIYIYECVCVCACVRARACCSLEKLRRRKIKGDCNYVRKTLLELPGLNFIF